MKTKHEMTNYKKLKQRVYDFQDMTGRQADETEKEVLKRYTPKQLISFIEAGVPLWMVLVDKEALKDGKKN
jgi:hypothetical protein